jgi:hypothetical protein
MLILALDVGVTTGIAFLDTIACTVTTTSIRTNNSKWFADLFNEEEPGLILYEMPISVSRMAADITAVKTAVSIALGNWEGWSVPITPSEWKNSVFKNWYKAARITKHERDAANIAAYGAAKLGIVDVRSE